MSKNRKIFATLGLVVIVAAIAVAAHAATSQPADVAAATLSSTAAPIATTTAPSPVPATAVPVATATPAASPYRDGTYSATAAYMTPDGDETVAVSVTLKNGIVTSSSLTSSGNNMQSKHYQDQFASGYRPYIIGKQLATIHLSRVSGSSLTPGGFNDAISQIKSRAL
jgi:hypothetical protein